MWFLQKNVEVRRCLFLRLVFTLADLAIGIYINIEIDVEIHVDIHVLHAHVVGCTTHLVQKRILSLRCGEEVVLSLEQTLIHQRVHIVADCIVQS
jgi:hypothetical protein